MLLSLFSGLSGFWYMFLSVSGGSSFPPPLSREEEAKAFEAMKNGDKKARQKLIEHNLRLVAHIVKKYYTSYDEQEELISIGTVGLIKAIDSYRPESGTKFATYGSRCLQNEILMYFRSRKKAALDVSIEETIDIDKEGNPLTYMDIIAVDDTIVEDIYTKNCIEKAGVFINTCLEKREREIICLRYGLGGGKPLTQRETAEKLGISRSYVSRIENSVMKRLQEYLSKTGI